MRKRNGLFGFGPNFKKIFFCFHANFSKNYANLKDKTLKISEISLNYRKSYMFKFFGRVFD